MGMIKSLAIGKLAEQNIIKLFESHEYICYRNEDKNIPYDITIVKNNITKTIEVKYDIMSEKTGNIAIEFYNSKSKVPSGINVTRADFWIHVLPNKDENHVHISGVNKVRSFINKHKPKRIVYSAGDDNADIMLYDKSIVDILFRRIDTVSTIMLNEILIWCERNL